MPLTWQDRIYVEPALMTITSPMEHDVLRDCTEMRLFNRSGSWRAIAWPSVPIPTNREFVMVGEVTVLEIREDIDREPMAMVNWRRLHESHVLDLLPTNHCPVQGVVLQTCELIKSIQTQSLREFMVETLRMTDVFEHYWTASASLSHHHAYPGGLAEHSLDVALATANIRGLSTWQRDLVVTYALLHDIGKVWAYVNDQLSDEARRLGHEALGYRALTPALTTLWETDEHTYGTLDALLSSKWKRTFRHPAAALGEIVRAMDRFSAARDIRNAPCEAAL